MLSRLRNPFAQWRDDPSVRRALEAANRGRAPDPSSGRFERVCLALGAAGILVCAATLVYHIVLLHRTGGMP